MTDTNNEWIEKAYKAYKKNIPNYINPIDSFKKAIEDNLPQSISREAVSKRETTEQQSENILTYEQWFERWKQVGYKEWRRDRGKDTTEEREIEIKEVWENQMTFTNVFDCPKCWWHIYWWSTVNYCGECWAKIKRIR